MVGLLIALNDIEGQMKEANCDFICQIYKDLPEEYEKMDNGLYKLKK